jgi:hypothetical protein
MSSMNIIPIDQYEMPQMDISSMDNSSTGHFIGMIEKEATLWRMKKKLG